MDAKGGRPMRDGPPAKLRDAGHDEVAPRLGCSHSVTSTHACGSECDNGAYVNRGWSRLYSSGDQFIAVRVVAGIVFLHANLARPTSGRAYCKIDSSLRPLQSIYLPTFYYGEDHVMGLWVPGRGTGDDHIYVYDVAGKAAWFQGIWSWPHEG